MTTELADDATHEQIQSFVDQIVLDRAGDDKGDARKIAEERDAPVGDLSAEEDAGGGDTPDKGEDTGKQDWLDDGLKAEVAAFGIGEEELADFTSREELDRALRFLDRSALEAGRKALAASDGGASRDAKGRYAKQEAKEEVEQPAKEGARYEIGLDKELYDEGLVTELTKLRDHYESRVAALEARFVEADARAEEREFDVLVDGLGHSDLFGKSGKESAQELQRRQDLFVAVKAQQLGLAQLGRGVALDQALVNRVVRMVFAEELGKKELKARTRKVAQQSQGRMGGSSTKPHDSAEPLRDEMRRLYKELENR